MGQVSWSVYSYARPTVSVGAVPFLRMDGLRTSVWGFSSHPVTTGVFPGGPRWRRESSVVLSSLQCSLSHAVVACPPRRHLLPVSGVPWCLALDPSRWSWSLCRRLLFAPCSRLRFLSWWSSLWLRVFRVVGSLHCSSLTVGWFLGHLHCTSSCPQVVFCAWKYLLLVGLRPLPDVSLMCPVAASTLTVALTAAASMREF